MKMSKMYMRQQPLETNVGECHSRLETWSHALFPYTNDFSQIVSHIGFWPYMGTGVLTCRGILGGKNSFSDSQPEFNSPPLYPQFRIEEVNN